mmetsp:Transcript_14574/g.57224  ORF Transcript_14574/g.57224 Transcript_14574/m.57224 type:complete len:91 (-) Transcript_14574:269-541(-)
MPKPVHYADTCRKYLTPIAGLPCIVMGSIFLLVGIFVVFFAERIALFIFLMLLGGLVILLGIVLLVIRCCCPNILPERRKVEGCLCVCIP